MTPAMGEQIVRHIWLTAQQRPAPDSVVIAEPGRVDIRLAGQRIQISEKMSVRAVIEQADAESIIERELARVSLEAREMAAGEAYIRLAELKLQRTQNNCMIEAVNAGGDSDTIAAIACSLAGARCGLSNIPSHLVAPLDVKLKQRFGDFISFVMEQYEEQGILIEER